MFSLLVPFFTWLGGFALKTLTGGSLESILSTIDKHMDADVEREKIKADVTKTFVEAQSQLLVGRTWWFQLFFVLPLGLWWSAVIFDSIVHIGHVTYALPAPLDSWAGWIVSALFLVDGTKAIGNSIIGKFKK